MIKQIAIAIAFATMTLGAPAQALTWDACEKNFLDATQFLILSLEDGDVEPWLLSMQRQGYSDEHILAIGDLSAFFAEQTAAGHSIESLYGLFMGTCVE